jgi:predicted alpha/beta hydrolase
MMAANAIDDRWSPPQSRDAFMAGYTNAARQTLDIDPARMGLRTIGHMGYFRVNAKPLWASALRWLNASPHAPSGAYA